MRKLTPAELCSLGLSTVALAVSIWAVVESRGIALNAHREEVRQHLVERAMLDAQVYSYAYCVLRVYGHSEREAEDLLTLKEGGKGRARLIDSAEAVSRAPPEYLGQIESGIAKGRDSLHGVIHEIMEIRLDMDAEQLAKVSSACGDPP